MFTHTEYLCRMAVQNSGLDASFDLDRMVRGEPIKTDGLKPFFGLSREFVEKCRAGNPEAHLTWNLVYKLYLQTIDPDLLKKKTVSDFLIALERWFAVCDEVIKNGSAADRRALRKQIGGMQAWCYRW
jgi:hypothetical protein